jgi:hypothetical protein
MGCAGAVLTADWFAVTALVLARLARGDRNDPYAMSIVNDLGSDVE